MIKDSAKLTKVWHNAQFVHNIETISARCNQKWYLWKWQFHKVKCSTSRANFNFSLSLSCYFHQISESERHNQDLSRKVFFPSPPSISRDGDGKIWIFFSFTKLHQLDEREMWNVQMSIFVALALYVDIWRVQKTTKKLDSKKMSVWFSSNWQWDWHFVAVRENAWTQNCRCHKYSHKYQNRELKKTCGHFAKHIPRQKTQNGNPH